MALLYGSYKTHEVEKGSRINQQAIRWPILPSKKTACASLKQVRTGHFESEITDLILNKGVLYAIDLQVTHSLDEQWRGPFTLSPWIVHLVQRTLRLLRKRSVRRHQGVSIQEGDHTSGTRSSKDCWKQRGGQTRTWLIAIGEMNQFSSICLSWFNSGNVLNPCYQSQLE